MTRRDVHIVLLVTAAVLLTVAALAACGWLFDDANLTALGFGAGAAWMVAQLA